MNILFLGTGAADWDIEAPKRPSDFRRFSSALVDGCLLIDPGPCVLEALEAFEASKEEIRYIINTHPHSDHYNESVVKALEASGAEFIPFNAGEQRQIGEYKIFAYAANHLTSKDPKHFIIEKDDKRLFYGLDSAWLLYDEVQAILRKSIDLAVLDATIGDISGDYRIFEHNNLNMVREMKKTLSPNVKRFIISHMAKTLHTDHKTLCEVMAKDGIEVAFDGFKTEI